MQLFLVLSSLFLAVTSSYGVEQGVSDYTLISEMLEQSTISRKTNRPADSSSFSIVFDADEEIAISNTLAAVDLTKKIMGLYEDGVLEGINPGDIQGNLAPHVDEIVDNLSNLGVRISELERKVSPRTIPFVHQVEEEKESSLVVSLRQELETERANRREFTKEMIAIVDKQIDKAFLSSQFNLNQLSSPPKRKAHKEFIREALRTRYRERFNSQPHF